MHGVASLSWPFDSNLHSASFGVMALRSGNTLQKLNIVLDVGRVKNVNKNPKAIQEF